MGENLSLPVQIGLICKIIAFSDLIHLLKILGQKARKQLNATYLFFL